MIWFCATVIGFAAYLYVFLLQPSIIGFEDEQGNTLNRLTDLVIMPGLADGIFGENGQFIFLIDRLPLLLGAALWLGFAGWIGWPIVRVALGDQNNDRPRQLRWTLLAVLSGLAILSTVTLLVGWCGGLGSRWPLAMAVAAVVLFATWVHTRLNAGNSNLAEGAKPESRKPAVSRRRRDRSAASHSRRNQPVKSNREAGLDVTEVLAPQTVADVWLARLIPVVTVALAICYLLGSMLPPWEFDVLEYHLQAPKEFASSGRIEYLDHNVYANMPLGAEMHSLAAMALIGGERGWWWGGLLGKTITGCYSLLAAGLVWSLVRERLGRGCAWCSSGLLLATGGNVHVSLAGLIDMAVGAYILAAMLVLVTIWPRLKAGQGRPIQVLLLGLLCGGCAACKYPGFLLAVLPCLLAIMLAAFWHRKPLPLMQQLACFGLALLLTCAPWLAKNTLQTGNPVYPLAYDLFGGGGLSEEAVDNWQRVHSPQPVNGQPAYSWGALWQSLRQLTIDSPFLNPSLVFLTLLGFCLCPRWQPQPSWLLPACGCIAWILTIWWLATHRIDRFWLPLLPVAALVAGGGAAQLGRHVSVGLAYAIALTGICFGFLQVLSGATPHDNRFAVSLATIEQEWIGFDTVGAITPTAWVNMNLSQDQKLLLIGDAQAYQYRVPIVYATCFNPTPGEAWLAGLPATVQSENLAKAGITHILVDWLEIERYRTPGNYGFSEWPTHADIDQMVADGVLKRVASPLDPEVVELLSVE